MPPLLLLSLSICCWANVIWYGTCLWPIWVSCSGYVIYQGISHPQPAGERGNVEKTTLMLHEHCSAVTKTLVCYQHCPIYQYKEQHYGGCYRENYFDLSQTLRPHVLTNSCHCPGLFWSLPPFHVLVRFVCSGLCLLWLDMLKGADALLLHTLILS